MSDLLLVSTRKGLFRVERRKTGWRIAGSSFLGDKVTLALHDRKSGRSWAALDHGHFGVKLQRSEQGHKKWKECAAPAYPSQPEGFVDKNAGGQVIPWTLKLVWALETGHPGENGVLWCGTIPGGLFRSGDGGDSWQLVESLWNHADRKEWFGGGADLPGIHSVLVDPRDARKVKVGVSCGGVWASNDGGNTWECKSQGMRAAFMPPDREYDPRIQDPHRVVQCAADPSKLWAQHHNGIFRSTDGSNSWHEITEAGPSTFGFAVAVHPRDGDTAWFVPAVKDEKRYPQSGRVVVTRTRDGGKSFEVLRKGLPQRHAYDLVYRHGLDIDESGDRLAFGSTTGGLWVTEDQGDTWRAVSAHLPPIYAVRFA